MVDSAGSDVASVVVQVLTAIVTRLPVLLACIAWAVALMLKIGREKGALLALFGVGGLTFIYALSPVVYIAVLPDLIDRTGMTTEGYMQVVQGVSLVIALVEGLALILVAIGTFMRPVAVGDNATATSG